MSRFYVSPDSVRDGKIYVGKEESHHIIDVMRLRKGDGVVVFDGTGKEYEGIVSSSENKSVILDIIKSENADKRPSVSISLAQAIPKKDKMDFIVQKATELGVSEIIPVETARTVVRCRGEKVRDKIERWRRITVEASKQCGRTDLPLIRDILRFDDLLDGTNSFDLTIMPCLWKKAISLKSALKDKRRPKNLLLVIGPEGDFSESEITKAQDKGAILVSLGRLVLKSDTAAIAAVAILNYEFNI